MTDEQIETVARTLFDRLGRGDWDRIEEYRRSEFRIAARRLRASGLLADGSAASALPARSPVPESSDGGSASERPDAVPQWRISIDLPMDATDDKQREDLFGLVADAVHGWEPADRDGWSACVSAGAGPSPASAPSGWRIDSSGWIVGPTGECTCEGPYEVPGVGHRPDCGIEPWIPADDLPGMAASEADLRKRASAWWEVAKTLRRQVRRTLRRAEASEEELRKLTAARDAALSLLTAKNGYVETLRRQRDSAEGERDDYRAKFDGIRKAVYEGGQDDTSRCQAVRRLLPCVPGSATAPAELCEDFVEATERALHTKQQLPRSGVRMIADACGISEADAVAQLRAAVESARAAEEADRG